VSIVSDIEVADKAEEGKAIAYEGTGVEDGLTRSALYLTKSDDDSHWLAGSDDAGFQPITLVGFDDGPTPKLVDDLIDEEYARAMKYPGPFSRDDHILLLPQEAFDRLGSLFVNLFEERLAQLFRERVPGFNGRVFAFFDWKYSYLDSLKSTRRGRRQAAARKSGMASRQRGTSRARQ